MRDFAGHDRCDHCIEHVVGAETGGAMPGPLQPRKRCLEGGDEPLTLLDGAPLVTAMRQPPDPQRGSRLDVGGPDVGDAGLEPGCWRSAARGTVGPMIVVVDVPDLECG